MRSTNIFHHCRGIMTMQYCSFFVHCLSPDRTSFFTSLHQLQRRVQRVLFHYNDVIMGTIASQITSLTIVYSTISSGADQRKHQSPASLAFVREIHRCFHLMMSSCVWLWPTNVNLFWTGTQKKIITYNHKHEFRYNYGSTQQMYNCISFVKIAIPLPCRMLLSGTLEDVFSRIEDILWERNCSTNGSHFQNRRRARDDQA